MVDVTFLRSMARHAVDAALCEIWPPVCVLCGGPGRKPALDLCAACEADLPLNSPACSICAQRLAPADADHSSLLCGECIRRAPRFDSACCAFRYRYPVSHLIRAFKYQRAVAPGCVLGELLARHIQRERGEDLPALLIPVPLAQRRFAARGYNQALELARRLERSLGVPMRTDLVVRTRDTAGQAGLKKKERRRNVRGAFELTGSLPARHIAIIDDVITTASTANEMARTLKRAGAKRVEVWAVARAERK